MLDRCTDKAASFFESRAKAGLYSFPLSFPLIAQKTLLKFKISITFHLAIFKVPISEFLFKLIAGEIF